MPQVPSISRQPLPEDKEFVFSIPQRRRPIIDADRRDAYEGLYRQIRRMFQHLGNVSQDGAFDVIEGDPGFTANDFKVQGGDGTAEGTRRASFKGFQCLLKEDVRWGSSGSTDGERSLLPQSTAVGSVSITDGTAKYETGELVGRSLIPNVARPTDVFVITANTATTITCAGATVAFDTISKAGDFYRVTATTPSGGDRTDTVWLNVGIQIWGADDDPSIQIALPGFKLEGDMRAKIRHTVHVRQGAADYTPDFTEYTDSFGRLHVVVKIAQLNRLDGVADILTAQIENLIPRLDDLKSVAERHAAFSGQLDLLDASPTYTALVNSQTDSPLTFAGDLTDYTATTYFSEPAATLFTIAAGTTERALVGGGATPPPSRPDDYWINTWIEIDVEGDGKFVPVRVTDYDSGTSTFTLAQNVRNLRSGVVGSGYRIVGDSLGQAAAKLDRTLRRLVVDAAEANVAIPYPAPAATSALLVSRAAANLASVLGEPPRLAFASGFGAGSFLPQWTRRTDGTSIVHTLGHISTRALTNTYHDVIVALDDVTKGIGNILGIDADLATALPGTLPATHTFASPYAFANPSTFTAVLEALDLAVERLAGVKLGEDVSIAGGVAADAPVWAQPFGATGNAIVQGETHHGAIEDLQAAIGNLDSLPGSAGTLAAAIAALAGSRIVTTLDFDGDEAILPGAPGTIRVNGVARATTAPIGISSDSLIPASPTAVLIRLNIWLAATLRRTTGPDEEIGSGWWRAEMVAGFDGLYRVVGHGVSTAGTTGTGAAAVQDHRQAQTQFDSTTGGNIVGGASAPFWAVIGAGSTAIHEIAYTIPSGVITPALFSPTVGLLTPAGTGANGGYAIAGLPDEYNVNGSVVAEWVDFG